MVISVHQPQYIPWLGYFHKILKSDCFVFLDDVQYKTREFQNRNKIRTKDGWIWLTVPVVSKGKGRQKISDVRIDNSFHWRKEHLESLKTFYGRSDYFNDNIDFFDTLYSKEWEKLSELNVAIIEYVLIKLDIKTPVYFESALDIKGTKTDRIIEICAKLKADTYLSGAGGREYLEEDKFRESRIKLEYQNFNHPVYSQQFMKDKCDFLPFMSVLDLLFNEGTKSKEILENGKILSGS
jgi:hypothetical protein